MLIYMPLDVDNELQTDLVWENETLKNSKKEKVLCVAIDNKLKFTTHLVNINKNTNSKFNDVTRVQKFDYRAKNPRICFFYYIYFFFIFH